MHKSLVAAAATAAVLAIGGPANTAAAMLVVTPNELGLAGGAATVERTVLDCDAWRCYWRPGYWGWYKLLINKQQTNGTISWETLAELRERLEIELEVPSSLLH
jgi:hypothetical protein